MLSTNVLKCLFLVGLGRWLTLQSIMWVHSYSPAETMLLKSWGICKKWKKKQEETAMSCTIAALVLPYENLFHLLGSQIILEMQLIAKTWALSYWHTNAYDSLVRMYIVVQFYLYFGVHIRECFVNRLMKKLLSKNSLLKESIIYKMPHLKHGILPPQVVQDILSILWYKEEK